MYSRKEKLEFTDIYIKFCDCLAIILAYSIY